METAQTLNYFLAGYAVIFGITLIYILSLLRRAASVKKELKLLTELMDEAEEVSWYNGENS